MALTIEDGTGLADADSLIDVVDVTAYLAARYTTSQLATWTAGSSGDKEIWTRQACQFMSVTYGPSIKGRRTSETQALPLPRTGMRDGEGYLIDDATIPQAFKDAQCELAMRAASGRLDADATASTSGITSESASVGGISESISYASVKSTQSSYTIVDRILEPYLYAGGQIVRA